MPKRSSIVQMIMSSILYELEQSIIAPQDIQQKILKYLIHNGKDSAFGKEHNFSNIHSYEDFAKNIPIRDYDNIQPYIDRLRSGEHYVLWNQKVQWYAKSSGTSSDKSKFIPITKENLKGCHYKGFKTMILSYLKDNPDSKLFSGKSMTLGGSVQFDNKNSFKYQTGDLSAILLSNSPKIAELIREPQKSTALISIFEEKLEKICRECSNKNITNFAGVPSWNLRMINRLLEYNNAQYLTDIWPNIELFMHGGISFEPYREIYKQLIPKENMNYLENYNASEGYFAFQNDPLDNSMLLTLNNDVYYEFTPLDDLEKALSGDNSVVCNIEGVKTGVNYAMIISTNAGLWRYLIEDCIEFSSTFPHKIKIVGRTQQYINVFGEELMIHTAEKALAETCQKTGLKATEYTVAPIFMKDNDKGSHEWLIEFHTTENEIIPQSKIEEFANILDKEICNNNSDYEAKRSGNSTLNRLTLTTVAKGTFYQWMKSRGKIGGQNKIPRMSNSRKYIDSILSLDHQPIDNQ